MNASEITDKYNHLRHYFRQHGAEKIIIWSSKVKDDGKGMILEIALDRVRNREKLAQDLQTDWKDDRIQITYLEDEASKELAAEIEADGMIL